MFKILIPAIFLMGNAFGEFNISNIKLTPTELEIVGDSLEDIQSVTIVSKDSSKEFEIENLSPNQVIARSLDTTMIEGLTLNLVISDSLKEITYPITISQKNGLVTFYKLQEKDKPEINSPNKMVLDHTGEINFSPGLDSTGYDYNYSLYANPTGDFAIKGKDKDLFTIDDQGNVEIAGTLKIKGKPALFNFPYKPTNELMVTDPTNSNSGNKVVLSSGSSNGLAESGYTIPMNICPKGQILKSDGVNFVCSLEASQEDQLGPVYTNQKSNFGIDQIYRDLQISNVVIDQFGNIAGVLNFTSSGNMNVATGTFFVDTAASEVGIGTAAPSVKLDIIGAVDSGIRLKQGAQATATVPAWKNGLVLEDSGGSTNAVAIGYGVGNLFSITAFSGIPRTVFTLDGTGNGAITGNLKIGAYLLPATDGTSGQVLKTNGTGTVSWGAAAATTAVDGPATSTVGNIAAWNNATGTLLADGGKLASNLVTNLAGGTLGYVPTFADGSGKVIQNGTKLEGDLVTGPANATATNLAAFSGITGKIIADSGVAAANVITSDNAFTAVNYIALAAGNNRKLKETNYTIPPLACANGEILKFTAGNLACSPGVGDVVGPASSTNFALARFDQLTGKRLLNSPATLDDAGALAGITSINTKTAADLVTMPTAATLPVGQVILSQAPGKALAPAAYTFPATTGTSGQVLRLGANNVDAAWATIGGGDVSSTGSPTNVYELAVYADMSGKLIRPVPLVYLNIVTNNATPTVIDHVAVFDSTTGKSIKDSGKSINDIVIGPAAGALIGTLASFSDNGGKLIGGSTVLAADVVTKATAPFTASNRVVLAGGNNRTLAETDYTFPTLSGGVGQILKMTAANQVTWVNVPSSFGDVTGPAATPTVPGSPATYADNTGKLLATVPYSLPAGAGTNGYVLTTNGSNAASWTAASGGDVVGPATSTTGNLASFGATGKIIQDSGVVAANVVTGPATASSTSIALFSGPTGKVIQSSVVSINGAGDLSGVGAITSTGNFTVTGNLTVTGTGNFNGALTALSYTNTSDRNLKKDITPFSGGDLIDKLMPVTFRWKKGDERPVIGLIAQDLEKVLPDVITISKRKEGSIRSYDVGQVLVLTIEALKETRAQVKMLEEKIKKLEQKNRK